MSNTKQYILLSGSSELSSYTDRYNQFELIEPTDLNLKPGYHTYKVYETTGATLSSTGLNEVEVGKALVIGSGQTTTIYSHSGNTTIYYK